MASTLQQLYDLILAKVLTGGRRTTASNMREVLNEMSASMVNKSGDTMTDDLAFPDSKGIEWTNASIKENGGGVDVTVTAGGAINFNAANIALNGATTFNNSPAIPTPTNGNHAANKDYVDSAVTGLWDDRGNFDASVNVFPSLGGSGAAGAIKKGDIWTISVPGTLGGSAVSIGNTVRALVDTPGQTSSNWSIGGNNFGYTPENSANKDTANGYPGLSSWKIKFRDIANAFTSFIQNAATAVRTYTFPDKDITVAGTNDLDWASGLRYTAAFQSAMERQQADVNLVFLTDSTGTNTTGWPYLLVQHIRALYPTHTVTVRFWNNSTQVYDSPTTLQTGTGSKTLAVYIGAMSGARPDYIESFPAICPVTPDLLFLSYGHNDNSPLYYLRKYKRQIQRLRTSYPFIGSIILVSQNPKISTNAFHENQLKNNESNIKMCRDYGLGFVNLMQAFFDYNGGGNAWVGTTSDGINYTGGLMRDDTHPNDAGQIYSSTFFTRLFPAKNYSVPATEYTDYDVIVVGPGDMYKSEGTPVLNYWANPTVVAGSGNGMVGWEFDPLVNSGISFKMQFPSHWKEIEAHFNWMTPVTDAGKKVCWRFSLTYYNPSSSLPTFNNSGVVSRTIGTAYQPMRTQEMSVTDPSFQPATRGVLMEFHIARVGTDAVNDTYTTNKVLLQSVTFIKRT